VGAAVLALAARWFHERAGCGPDYADVSVAEVGEDCGGFRRGAKSEDLARRTPGCGWNRWRCNHWMERGAEDGLDALLEAHRIRSRRSTTNG